MTIGAKICGINSVEAGLAAASHGARHVGFVFFPPSPRNISVARAAEIAHALPASVGKVAVLVNPDDVLLEELVAAVPLDLIQLHGGETPRRVADIRARFGIPVMKAIPIAGPGDLAGADAFASSADWLLFDAKPPKAMAAALPGGNGLALDWDLLAGRTWPLPWILSGGLDSTNVAEAVRRSGATLVDVSSGVEERPGVKDPARIARFLEVVRGL